MKFEKVNTLFATDGQNLVTTINKMFARALEWEPGTKVKVELDTENERLIISKA
jgi:hypothetical protein